MSTVFIPEVGLSHDGSLSIALAYIRQLAADGASIVKFQCHLPEFEPWQQWRPGTPADVTQGRDRLDYLAETAFSQDQWARIRDECHRVGVKFACSVFCPEAVDYLGDLPDVWKVPHTKATDPVLAEALRDSPRLMMVSTNPDDFAAALALYDGELTVYLFCDGQYPATPLSTAKTIHGAVKQALATRVIIGASLHSVPSWAVTAIGMACFHQLPYVEAHVIFSRLTPVPDAPWSLEPDQWRAAIQATRALESEAG